MAANHLATRTVHSVVGTPADKTVRYATLELDGETYSLVFNFNAIAVAEKESGVNLFEAWRFSEITVSQYRALLYAALLKAHPDLTLEEVGELISIKNMASITNAILQAWKNSMIPEGEDENPTEAVPAA